jgi:hypothetical protein
MDRDYCISLSIRRTIQSEMEVSYPATTLACLFTKRTLKMHKDVKNRNTTSMLFINFGIRSLNH